MSKYSGELYRYESLNKIAKKGGAVFLGADLLCRVPFAEVAHDKDFEAVLHNRSIEGLIVDDAEGVLKECVYDLYPNKVFINIGENDIKNDKFDIDTFVEKYEWVLYNIHAKCNCPIYIMSVISDGAEIVNKKLKQIAMNYECEYIDISELTFSDLLSGIRMFLRKNPISFFEAMTV